MEFRKDIEIIRAIAIINVFFFHLGISSFQLGFIGVDIFFVISGYLMASIYKNTSIKDYYIRRFNRLIPSYYITIILVIIASLFILEYTEFRETIYQIWYALSFTSNIGFWLENTYFNKDNFKPLLHMWTLAIEFQFYLILPLITFLFRKNKYIIIIMFFISLLICFIMTEFSPKTSFFLIFFRIWEFLLGYIIAKYALLQNIHKKNTLKINIISIILLILIIFSSIFISTISLLDIHISDFIYGHPGMFSLFICIITGLLLIFGIPNFIQNSKVGNILTFIGKYSYSIYLIHYPIIILYLYKPLSGTILKFNNYYQITIIMIIIIVTSYIFQNIANSLFIKKVFTINRYLYFFVFIVLFAFASLSIKKNMTDKVDLNIYNARFDITEYRCGKIKRIMNPLEKLCSLNELPDNSKTQNIILIGDSHADAIKYSFTEVASKLNKKVYFLVQNNPLMNGNNSINAKTLLKEINKYNIDHAIIHYSSILNKAEIINFIILANKQNIIVSFLMPIPTPEFNVPRAMYNNIKYNKKIIPRKLEDYKIEYKETKNILKKDYVANLKIYDVDEYFCTKNCIYSLEDGTPLFIDSHHLTISGANLLKPLFKKLLEIK